MTNKLQKRQKRVDLVCVLTGELVLKQPRSRVESQAKKLKFSDVEDYINFFVGREARKLLAKGFTELEIRKQFNCKETKSVPFHVLKCYVKKFKSKEVITRARQKKVVEEFKDNPVIVQWKGPDIVNLLENKEVCARVTQSACWRPDIYLDLGCNECILKENCACPIKDTRRKPLYARRIKKA